MYDYRNILSNVFQTKRKIRFCVTISVTQKNPSLGILLWWSMRSVAVCRLPWGEIRIEIHETYEFSTVLSCQRLHANSAVGRPSPRRLFCRRPVWKTVSSLTGYVGMVRHSNVPGFPHPPVRLENATSQPCSCSEPTGQLQNTKSTKKHGYFHGLLYVTIYPNRTPPRRPGTLCNGQGL